MRHHESRLVELLWHPIVRYYLRKAGVHRGPVMTWWLEVHRTGERVGADRARRETLQEMVEKVGR